MMGSTRKRDYVKRDTSILFADVKGFSRLSDHQARVFLEKVLPLVSHALRTGPVHYPNTWGDGIVAFYDSAAIAVRAALSLRDRFRQFDWSGVGMPRLEVRVALHAGEAYEGWDYVREAPGRIGVQINRAARIEPIVAPNHVYVTDEFRQRCKDDGVIFEDLGTLSLAKSWGDDRLHVAAWLGEKVDLNAILRRDAPAGTRDAFDPETFLGNFGYSQFVRRLAVCADAKRDLARFAVDEALWSADESVFLQSGTISVYLMSELLRRGRPDQRPPLIVTNSTVLPLMGALAGVQDDDSQIVYPDDDSLSVALENASRVAAAPPILAIGGVFMENAAAVIPRGFFANDDKLRSACDDVLSICAANDIKHVVMMMTGFRSHHGPFAVSDGWRKFNKVLMHFVAHQPSCRLTLFAEADKVIKLVGDPADDVDLPIDGGDRLLWPSLRREPRVKVVIAEGSPLNTADDGFVRRQLAELDASGLSTAFIRAGSMAK
jgi:class 3 adenylate cyclase